MKSNLITLELRHVEINISFSARIVQLAKTKAITRFLAHATASRAAILVTQHKSLEM